MEDVRFKMLLETAPVPIIIVDEEGKITLINSQSEKCFGYHREELIGKFVEVLLPDEYREAHISHRKKYMKKPVTRAMGTGINLKLKRKDGVIIPVDISLSPLEVENGTIITLVVHDITEQKQLEEKYKYLAEHDPLTGVVNRYILEDRIDQAVKIAKRHQWLLAIFFLDIDGFKDINDSHGHVVGDLLLRATVQRIQECIRSDDTLARNGGDEFVLLLVNINDKSNAIKLAQKIHKRFDECFLIENLQIRITLSIGISIYPGDGDSHESLIKKADAAMYYVKKNGKNNFKLYDKSEMG